jgi:hypothetical protein
MISRISDLEDAELCKRILAVVSVVYRPLTLDELETFVNMPAGASLREIIELCGSFLTLQNRIVSFVHQSAKEYLLKRHSMRCFHLRRLQQIQVTVQEAGQNRRLVTSRVGL